jgi:hypothetical protein
VAPRPLSTELEASVLTPTSLWDGRLDYMQVSQSVSTASVITGRHISVISIIIPGSCHYSMSKPLSVVNCMQEIGVVPLAWGPLGGDPLAGVNRLFNFAGDRQIRILGALNDVAKDFGPGEWPGMEE